MRLLVTHSQHSFSLSNASGNTGKCISSMCHFAREAGMHVRCDHRTEHTPVNPLHEAGQLQAARGRSNVGSVHDLAKGARSWFHRLRFHVLLAYGRGGAFSFQPLFSDSLSISMAVRLLGVDPKAAPDANLRSLPLQIRRAKREFWSRRQFAWAFVRVMS